MWQSASPVPVGADALGGPPRPFVSLRTNAALPPLKGEVLPAFAPVTEGFSVAIRIPRSPVSS